MNLTTCEAFRKHAACTETSCKYRNAANTEMLQVETVAEAQ